jgi:hypothetical protein
MKKTTTPKKSITKGTAAKKSAGKAVDLRARRTPTTPSALLTDLRLLIEQARSRVAQAINSELVLLYWQVGQRINQDVLKGRRAEYGKEIGW